MGVQTEIELDQELRDVVIIGSGPAGLTAAVYCARANLVPLVLEGELSSTGDQPGGQLMLTTEVENYPGFPDGVLGPVLMAQMRAQAERFGAQLVASKATRVKLQSGGPHTVWFRDPSSGEELEVGARAVIVATGARSLMLGLPKERELLGHGVSTCATCDGFFFRGQHIAVIGGGDSALEEAVFLSRFAESVTVVHRRGDLRASKIMQDRALANPKVKFAWHSVVAEVLGDLKVEGLKLRDVKSGAESVLPVTGVFIAIGHAPIRTSCGNRSCWTRRATSSPSPARPPRASMGCSRRVTFPIVGTARPSRPPEAGVWRPSTLSVGSRSTDLPSPRREGISDGPGRLLQGRSVSQPSSRAGRARQQKGKRSPHVIDHLTNRRHF